MKNEKTPRQLSEEAKRLAAIFEYSQDGIITINTKGLIESINPAAAHLFGYTPKEVIDQNINILMPKPYHSAHDQYIHNYVKTRKKKIIGIGRDVKGKRKDGSIFPFFLSVSEVKLEDKTIFTGFIHDLTAYKKKETEIQELNQLLEQKVISRTNELSNTVNKLLSSNKQLEFEIKERKKVEEALRQSEMEILSALEKEKELGELKSRFVSMASHEFRTPLSTILSSVSLIGRYKEAGQIEKIDKHVDRVKSAVENLTGILNDFLSLSKLEEGKVENNPETFLLFAFCKKSIDELQGLLKQGQEIKFISEGEDFTIFLDKRILKNILFNLLSNAIKYSPEHKPIHCEKYKKEDTLNIIIRDEGIGIPQADQEHLFSRFFRATNVTNIQGTGLGLNIVKKYVALLEGNISFKSEFGKGTSFHVQIPIKTKQ